MCKCISYLFKVPFITHLQCFTIFIACIFDILMMVFHTKNMSVVAPNIGKTVLKNKNKIKYYTSNMLSFTQRKFLLFLDLYTSNISAKNSAHETFCCEATPKREIFYICVSFNICWIYI